MTSKEQERPKVPKSRIPTFKTIEEEAAFWDTHSSEDFADELTHIENVKFIKSRSRKGGGVGPCGCPDFVMEP